MIKHMMRKKSLIAFSSALLPAREKGKKDMEDTATTNENDKATKGVYVPTSALTRKNLVD